MSTDSAIRAAAFVAIERLAREHPAGIPWRAVKVGFEVGGEAVHFAGRAVGIFKPRQLAAALSIRTVVPKTGRRTWYQDQEGGLESDPTSGLMRYSLSRTRSMNRALREAMELRAPLIWFVGLGPARYEALFPVFVEAIQAGEALLSTRDGPVVQPPAEQVMEPSWSLQVTRRRNHQQWFSMRTRSAYGQRCAFSGLPVRELLVGAHIVPDAAGGPASVTNGVCMSTLHHTAFDANLIGVDPDLKIHVSPSLRARKDGDLWSALAKLDGAKLRPPRLESDRPKPEYLERRFADFRAAHR